MVQRAKTDMNHVTYWKFSRHGYKLGVAYEKKDSVIKPW